MALQVVLLAGKPSERLQVLSEKLSEETLVQCHVENSLEELSPIIDMILPDLVLVFADDLEKAGENVNKFCQDVRQKTFSGDAERRPVMIVETGARDENRRIQYLLDGADDTLSSELGTEELRIRLLVQLRRNLDLMANTITTLPGMDLVTRILQRKINRKLANPEGGDRFDWALILTELDGFEVYNEVYGNLAGNQVLRTFAALLTTLVLAPDFVGHSAETNTFFIMTHPDRAEKIASILCRQFEAVVPNFYSEKDRKRGYLISVSEGKISRRIPLLALSMGVVNSHNQSFNSYKGAIHSANEMKNLARFSPGNTWASDRLKLTGAHEIKQDDVSRVLVVESDAALAFLLKTTLEMQHYQVEAVSNPEEALHALSKTSYRVVLLDSILQGEPLGWDLCRRIKEIAPHTMAIFISTVHDREQALSAGADLYLPKPFELSNLFNWLEHLVQAR